MVLCKYFLQGTCRFGESCKFEHQLNNEHSYANPTSILLQNYGNKPAQTTTNVDTNTLVKSVVTDMTSAEKGGQWLLSSYAPFKEKPAFPGFEDHSMEEIRFLFYESVKNGTVEQFKQNLQMILQQAVMKIKALQNPSPDAVNMLKSIYNTAPSSSFNNTQTPFNNTPTNTIFSGPQPQPQQNTIFGGSPPNQTVFSQPSTPSNIFGANQPTQQNIFRGPNTNSIFAGGQTNTSVFAGQQPANQNKSIFGTTQPTPPTNSVFGGSPIFAGATPSVFANQPQTALPFTQSGPFNQQGQQMTFTTPTPQQNIFQQNVNQFGQMPNQYTTPQPTAPIIGENKPSIQHSTNIFGNLGMQASNPIFGGVPNRPKPDEDFYSKLEELSEEEIKWFQSDDLDINKIPEKPPTYEMCFKV